MMKSGSHDATLSNWIICELSDGRRFVAGKVSGDRKGRFREGAYITTSLLVSPIEAIADGEIIETLNSRYLLTERNKADDEIFAKLDAWLAQQPTPPTLFDVLAVRDIDLLNAFVLRGFRAAAAEAAWRSKKAD
ncbi:hypothetical protein ACFQPG_00955 [Sphingomonas sp. GCM10030256]|uniref:hypothetical protein n=1 Tax=Sphingomonas sp. GCM10030256 TaxID=3273427 RepID=UPI00361E6301